MHSIGMICCRCRNSRYPKPFSRIKNDETAIRYPIKYGPSSCFSPLQGKQSSNYFNKKIPYSLNENTGFDADNYACLGLMLNPSTLRKTASSGFPRSKVPAFPFSMASLTSGNTSAYAAKV